MVVLFLAGIQPSLKRLDDIRNIKNDRWKKCVNSVNFVRF